MSDRLLARLVRPRSEAALLQELEALGLPPSERDLIDSGGSTAISVQPVGPTVARAVREAARVTGANVLVTAELAAGSAESGAVLLGGTRSALGAALDWLAHQSEPSVRSVAEAASRALTHADTAPPPLTIGPLKCVWGEETLVMGIVNVTPDSFSGDGLLARGTAVEAAVVQARQLVGWGASILDVGGESTRPGSEAVELESELERVIPAIAAIVEELGDRVAISVDTYKATVAREAVAAGAHLVNDVWGLRMDPDMAATVAELGVPVVVMHNRMRPKNAVQEARLGGRYLGVHYDHLMADVTRELGASIELALAAGIAEERIIVDPGLGFGKTVPQSLELLNRLDELRVFGRPILLGPSRKSFIGYTLDLPPEERVEGTAAAVAIGIARGADIVRVHDVREMARVARMADAVVRENRD